ncbi:MAG: NifB/NifX family molybdenum-iron cluster-binding protein [Ralstonia sp.]|nr:MAG: NifB/NifX family molybdenum-iron cluster-binding protein [Ralstonia sp.]
MKVAAPCDEGRLAEHFGHAPQFAMFDTDPENRRIIKEEVIEAPPHQPGLLPKWLAEHGADVILAGGMGHRAKSLFDQNGIRVVVGITAETARAAVEAYLNDSLAPGPNLCDH